MEDPALRRVEARHPWEVITLDFLCGLAPARGTGHTAILVVCDRFSRRIKAIGCHDHLSARDTAKLLLERVVLEHGLPLLIITDRGPQFESTMWLGLWDALGSRAALATTHHPQTDGLSERTNRTLLGMIRKYCQGHPQDWEERLPYLVFAFNSAKHLATGCSPFVADTGREALVPSMVVAYGSGPRAGGGAQAKAIEAVRQQTKEALEFVRAREQKLRDEAVGADPSKEPLAPGEEVLIDWAHLGGMVGTAKMRPAFGGPYLVKGQVSSGAYEIQGMAPGQPTVFHRSALRRFRRDTADDSDDPDRIHPPASRLRYSEGKASRELAAIWEERRTPKGLEYLVEWRGVPERTWERAENVSGCGDALRSYRARKRARTERARPVRRSPARAHQ